MTSHISKTLKNSVLALVAALGFALTAHAQQTSGNIIGEAVTGDTVEVRSDEIGFHREVSVEKDGRYSVRRVPAGIYEITIKHADGTQAETKQVRVQVGSTARVQ